MSTDDTPEQQRLLDLSMRIKRMLDDHDVGGCFVVVSKDSAEWLNVSPKWSGLDIGQGKADLDLCKEDREKAKATLHFLEVCRDVAEENASVFAMLFNEVTKEIQRLESEPPPEPSN